MNLELRHLSSLDEYAACLALQKETWGHDFHDAVPISILMVSQKVGGIAAGAFDENGAMLGCVYGITGYKEGRPVHWSDILAVTPKARGLGLGKKLKLFQRDALLKMGVETMFWTFDPLQALNANLNINSLGAVPAEYVVDMYGETGSDLHSGLGTDRLITRWDMTAERTQRILAGTPPEPPTGTADAPVVNTVESEAGPEPFDGELPQTDPVRIEIPNSINDTKRSHTDAGPRWRECTRRAFTHYLENGYDVVALTRNDPERWFYVLAKKR